MSPAKPLTKKSVTDRTKSDRDLVNMNDVLVFTNLLFDGRQRHDQNVSPEVNAREFRFDSFSNAIYTEANRPENNEAIRGLGELRETTATQRFGRRRHCLEARDR
jgi:hypothetical protein